MSFNFGVLRLGMRGNSEGRWARDGGRGEEKKGEFVAYLVIDGKRAAVGIGGTRSDTLNAFSNATHHAPSDLGCSW